MELLVALPYSSRIDERGDVRMSSHTALVTDAALHLAQERPDDMIYIPGESTFGPDYPSTGELMKRQLIKKGVDPERIIVQDGLNNTEDQLLALQAQRFSGYLITMNFHMQRVYEEKQRLVAPEGLILSAEHVVSQYHKGATKERLLKFANGKDKKVFGSEKIVRTLSRHILGRALLSAARIYTNPTVTDYHHVEPARKHFARARKAGII